MIVYRLISETWSEYSKRLIKNINNAEISKVKQNDQAWLITKEPIFRSKMDLNT